MDVLAPKRIPSPASVALPPPPLAVVFTQRSASRLCHATSASASCHSRFSSNALFRAFPTPAGFFFLARQPSSRAPSRLPASLCLAWPASLRLPHPQEYLKFGHFGCCCRHYSTPHIHTCMERLLCLPFSYAPLPRPPLSCRSHLPTSLIYSNVLLRGLFALSQAQNSSISDIHRHTATRTGEREREKRTVKFGPRPVRALSLLTSKLVSSSRALHPPSF